MIITDERAGDEARIAEITREAFALTPHGSGAEAQIVAALRQAGALTLSLVAIEGIQLVGHIAFSAVEIPDMPSGLYGLGPVSVRPGSQRQGIGDALVRAGLERLRDMGAAGCVVLGDPEYYRRFGFCAAPGLTYGDVSPGYMQGLSFCGAVISGKVRYHAAFDAG